MRLPHVSSSHAGIASAREGKVCRCAAVGAVRGVPQVRCLGEALQQQPCDPAAILHLRRRVQGGPLRPLSTLQRLGQPAATAKTWLSESLIAATGSCSNPITDDSIDLEVVHCSRVLSEQYLVTIYEYRLFMHLCPVLLMLCRRDRCAVHSSSL